MAVTRTTRIVTRSTLLLVAIIAASGCRRRATGDFEISVVESEVQVTAPWIEFTTEQPGTSWIEFTFEGRERRSTSTTAAGTTEHRHRLLGLPPEMEVEVHAVFQADGAEDEVEVEGSLTTGAIPDDIPVMPLLHNAEGSYDADSYVLLMFHVDAAAYQLIVDRQARTVWYNSWTDDRNSMGAVIDVEEGMLYSAVRTTETYSFVEMYKIPLLSDDEPVMFEVGEAHHDWERMPDGSYGVIEAVVGTYWSNQEDQMMPCVGDQITLFYEDASSEVLFNTFDWREPVEEEMWVDGEFYDEVEDWTHGNHLDYRESTNSVLFSIRNQAVLVEVDFATGEVLETYGGQCCSDFAGGYQFAEGTEQFFYQHGAEWLDNGNLLMVSTPLLPEGGIGRDSVAVEYELDHDNKLMTEIWRYSGDIFASSGGYAQRLANGNTLVEWGHPTPAVREVSPDSEVVWSTQGPDTSRMITAFAFDSFYP
jgi:hypothetical protein